MLQYQHNNIKISYCDINHLHKASYVIKLTHNYILTNITKHFQLTGRPNQLLQHNKWHYLAMQSWSTVFIIAINTDNATFMQQNKHYTPCFLLLSRHILLEMVHLYPNISLPTDTMNKTTIITKIPFNIVYASFKCWHTASGLHRSREQVYSFLMVHQHTLA